MSLYKRSENGRSADDFLTGADLNELHSLLDGGFLKTYKTQRGRKQKMFRLNDFKADDEVIVDRIKQMMRL